MSSLQAKNMIAGYGEVSILNGCSISVEDSEISVIVGPNGAGKSTAMKAIFGLLPLKSGSIVFNNQDITTLDPRKRVEQGMAFVPQTDNIFTSMTVEENLEMGAFIRKDDYQDSIDQIYQISPILHEKRNQLAGELSGGQRQQLAVGRAMMTNPSLIMMDEPTAGVSPIVMDDLFNRIISISKLGVSVLMVEQNATKALQIADKGYVLVAGENRFTGHGTELLNDTKVRKTFLGG